MIKNPREHNSRLLPVSTQRRPSGYQLPVGLFFLNCTSTSKILLVLVIYMAILHII